MSMRFLWGRFRFKGLWFKGERLFELRFAIKWLFPIVSRLSGEKAAFYPVYRLNRDAKGIRI